MSTLKDFEAKVFEKINPAVRFSVTRYVMAIGFFVAVVVFGLWSTVGLGVDLLPSVSIPVVTVQTSFPGANPQVVDEQVTQLVENTVSTLSGITDISSSSSTGNSRVTISFDTETDKNAAANRVAALVSGLTRRLPSGANPPTVQTLDLNAQPILQFGLSGEGVDMESIAEYAKNTLEPLMARVDDVANIQVDGAPERQFQILLNPDRLQFFRLNPNQIVAAINSSAVNQPIGTIVTKDSTLTYSSRNVPEGTFDLEKIMADPARGITLRDIAEVREVPVKGSFARINGIPVVLVSIQKTADGNSVQVAKDLHKLLKDLTLPKGYHLVISNDTTVPIQASVESTYNELFITAIVVALIVLLFLGKLNTAFSVILAIPIALAAAPILYALLGFSFNLVSLLALIVAIGIVVDDSIVLAENVERYRAMGYGLMESVYRGASEVFSAVVAATLSILAVLLPVSFIGGFIARYLTQFSLGLSAAVFFSLVEAVLFLTVRMAYTPDTPSWTWKDCFHRLFSIKESFFWGLKAMKKPLVLIATAAAAAALYFTKNYIWLILTAAAPLCWAALHYLFQLAVTFLQALTTPCHKAAEKILGWIRDRYASSLKHVLKVSGWLLGAMGVFFVATVVFIYPRIPSNFVPQIDGGTVQIFLRMPQGTPTALTNALTSRVEDFLLEKSEVVTVQTVIGGGGVSLLSGSTSANLLVTLVPVEERKGVFALIPDYRKELNTFVSDIPSARISVSAGGGFQGQGSGVSLSLVGPDFDRLTEVNNEVLDFLQSHEAVGDASSSLAERVLENNFIPNEAFLKGTGITPSQLAQNLQIFTTGVQAGSVQKGGLSYPIQVTLDPLWLTGGQSLSHLPLFSSTLQTTLQISQLGEFRLVMAPNNLSRLNRQYSAQLNINLKPLAPSASEFQALITKQMTEAGILGNGVSMTTNSRFSIAALSSQLAVTGMVTFVVAIFLAYLVMGAQFNSWRYPLYLLLPVPLALVGALWLVFALGTGLDIFGLLGMLMLIGLSAKNAILYLEFVVERLGSMPLIEALIESAKLRFRPIIMTTLTVLVISFPLIMNQGQGSEFGQKLGVVMLGGVASSAILTFFVVPAAFYLFEGKKHLPIGSTLSSPEL